MNSHSSFIKNQSGAKIEKPNGVMAIKNGIKPGGCSSVANPAGKKPDWLKIKIASSPVFNQVREVVHTHQLSTVCEEAMCPNMHECWSAGTATLMLMGSVCTRACRFCAVDTGNPKGWLDLNEPKAAAETVKKMGLSYVVLTSVNRDDLPDGGAMHYAACVREIKALNPKTQVEVLTPDFQGSESSVQTLLDSGIAVFAQNLETVRRLTHPVRDPRAGYDQTLSVLAFAKKTRPDILVKTSLMLGLGEQDEELFKAMDDLREIHVDILTLGQYLRPTMNHLPIERYVPPSDFARYREIALSKGFLEVVAGPMVRSSYRAEQALQKHVKS